MLAAGHKSFYKQTATGRQVYDPASGSYVREPKPDSYIVLSDLKRSAKKIIYQTKGASLVDLGDGVACVEFHSTLQPKMNPIDDQIIEVIQKGIEIGERDFRGLVVHHQGENFCAGANLLMILEGIEANQWTAIDQVDPRVPGHDRPAARPDPGRDGALRLHLRRRLRDHDGRRPRLRRGRDLHRASSRSASV